MPLSRRQFGVLASVAAAGTALAACTEARQSSGGPATATAANTPTAPASSASTSVAPPPPSPVTLALYPANQSSSVNPATPVTVTAGGGTIEAVTLRSSDGATVPGKISTDGTAWTSAAALGYTRSYTLTASARNSAGVPASQTAKFSTAAPSNLTMPYINDRAGNAIDPAKKYGVGMVIKVHFDEEIGDRAAAEKALLVVTEPATVGSWYWVDDQNLLWRPKNFYAAGTKVTVYASVYGVQVGPGLYGQANTSTSFTIGQKQVSIADDTTHMVSVYFNDKLQRVMPTAMGRGGYVTGVGGQQISLWTPSGTYTVLDQGNPVLMDSASFGLPENSPYGYKEYIPWATRISTDGIYLHELDTTVWAQGHTDVSHGCLNLNHDNAYWYYHTAQVGDVVIVQHTGGPPLAQYQNGDWSVPWAQWIAGSALKSA